MAQCLLRSCGYHASACSCAMLQAVMLLLLGMALTHNMYCSAARCCVLAGQLPSLWKVSCIRRHFLESVTRASTKMVVEMKRALCHTHVAETTVSHVTLVHLIHQALHKIQDMVLALWYMPHIYMAACGIWLPFCVNILTFWGKHVVQMLGLNTTSVAHTDLGSWAS